MTNPRLAWLWLFIIINIAAALIMSNTGELIGDLEGVKLYSQNALIWATIIVIASYYIVLGPVFSYVSKIKIRKIKFHSNNIYLGKKIGQLLIALQLFFITFNLSTGINVAGSNNMATNSPFALFWVLIPIDSLFIIYYGLYRENKYFYPNLLIWLLSNLMRGWAGIFAFVIFFEWCRAIRNKKLNLKIAIPLGITIIALYPLLQNLKWIIRASSGANINLEMITEGFVSFLESGDYLSLLGNGVTHIIGRLQCTSFIVEVMHLSDLLQEKFSLGEFAPFWKEGLHGIFFDRLFAGEKQLFIGVAFTRYLDFGFQYEVGDWNVSLGYASWFFIDPMSIPLYLAYTFFLGFISFYLLKKIGKSELSTDMLWWIWMVYLMAPWLLTFTSFLYALFVFLIIKLSISRLSNPQSLGVVNFNTTDHHRA